MQVAKSKKPALFNRKLFPLIRRYIIFSKSPSMLYTFFFFFVATPILIVAYKHLPVIFLFLFLLSYIVLIGKYGANESFILALLPISKKQSVLVRCIHLIVVQLIVFAAMIGLSLIKRLIMFDTGLYATNRLLTIAALVVSASYMNIIILTSYFKSGKPKRFIKVLLALVSLFILPSILPLVLMHNDYVFSSITTNLSLAPIILGVCLGAFMICTLVSSVYAIKNCSLHEMDLPLPLDEANQAKTNMSTSIAAQPDGLILSLYLRLLRFFRVDESTIKLVAKDCHMIVKMPLLLFIALIFALQFIPIPNMPFILVSALLTMIPHMILVVTGDLRISKILPVKAKSYVKSKHILAYSLQTFVIVSMFIVCLIAAQFGYMPILLFENVRLEFFGTLFIGFAATNLVFFLIVFKHPFKSSSYILSGVVFFFVFIPLSIIFEGMQSTHAVALFAVGFAIFSATMAVSYALTKNKRTDL